MSEVHKDIGNAGLYLNMAAARSSEELSVLIRDSLAKIEALSFKDMLAEIEKTVALNQAYRKRTQQLPEPHHTVTVPDAQEVRR